MKLEIVDLGRPIDACCAAIHRDYRQQTCSPRYHDVASSNVRRRCPRFCRCFETPPMRDRALRCCGFHHAHCFWVWPMMLRCSATCALTCTALKWLSRCAASDCNPYHRVAESSTSATPHPLILNFVFRFSNFYYFLIDFFLFFDVFPIE